MPHSFATMVGVEERVVQMLDEFQNLNLYIDAGVEDKPCRKYLSTAESRVAPARRRSAAMRSNRSRSSGVGSPR